ncbi:hypothetical protein Hanom_Chr08g00727011 [Helianthus anomalus]
MYVARGKITSLEADVANLKKSEATFKEKYEEAKSHREHVEVEVNAQILSKDKDLAGKDAEIVELKAQEKNESLEIDLDTEKVKADTAEEARKAAEVARKISTSALNVAQTNYVEAQLMSVVMDMQKPI